MVWHGKPPQHMDSMEVMGSHDPTLTALTPNRRVAVSEKSPGFASRQLSVQRSSERRTWDTSAIWTWNVMECHGMIKIEYTHTHFYIYIYTHTHRYRYMIMCIYIYTHAHTHIYIYIYKYT